jgi:ribosomal protein S18 acetylase RimI-like enzyme
LSAYTRASGAFTLVAEDNTGPDRLPGAGDVPAPIVGFVVAHLNRSAAGHIITIDVLAGARRQGLGSRLLEAAEERLRLGGCRTIRLETAVDNTSALTFYKRHGYRVVKTIPRYYPGDLDAFALRKDLHSPPRPDNLPA